MKHTHGSDGSGGSPDVRRRLVATPATPATRGGDSVHAAYADVVSRRRAEAEREERLAHRRAALADVEGERSQLFELFMQAPIPIAVLDGADHTFALANPLYVQTAGRALVGKRYCDAFPELASSELPVLLDRVYATGDPHVAREVAVRVDRRGDGTMTDALLTFHLAAMRDGGGRIHGIMAIVVDVTDQARARQRTDAARAAAENANRAKDDFLAMVSHELRTPLNGILGWARMLRGGALASEKRARALETIERSAKAQMQLIEDLLDVSRIVNGKLRLELRPIEPIRVVEMAIEAVRPAAEARGVRLETALELQGRALHGDADRLQQVVCNLLTNAVKFTPRGGLVRVHLRHRAREVEIAVVDTGRGIRAEFLPHVFERFRQAERADAQAHGGLGLGLAIAQHIVALHGGTIAAHSAGEGRGATFVVRLPVSRR